MRYPIVCLAGMMCMLGAYADNNNTATSKDYVDTQIETLQDEIPAIDTNTVLTHTGTSGEIGSKKIYDSTQDFATQTDALVTAETFNAAIQNAIDNEYVCIEWLGEHVPGNCLLWQIRAGTPKTIVPKDYTQLEYLESQGNQWIDTGIAASNNIGIIIDFQYTNSDPAEQIIIGAFNPNFLIDRWNGEFSYAYRPGMGLDKRWAVSTVALTERYTSEFNWKNSKLFKLGNIVSTLPNTVFSNSKTLYVFSTGGNNSFKTKSGRVYNLKISNNSDVVRNLIPVRRNSDSEIGMYDLISNTFFTNRGTGTFIAGPEVSSNIYLPSGD